MVERTFLYSNRPINKYIFNIISLVTVFTPKYHIHYCKKLPVFLLVCFYLLKLNCWKQNLIVRNWKMKCNFWVQISDLFWYCLQTKLVFLYFISNSFVWIVTKKIYPSVLMIKTGFLSAVVQLHRYQLQQNHTT